MSSNAPSFPASWNIEAAKRIADTPAGIVRNIGREGQEVTVLTLGELRKHWHKDLQAKLAGEIAKDLTGHSTDQIAAAVEKA